MKCIDITVKSALNVFRDDGYSLNPYRGCSHGCAYCYAAGEFWRSHLSEYFPSTDTHYHHILVKQGIDRVLRRELMQKKPYTLYIGTITDPYQPCEGIKKITRKILKSLIYLPPKNIHILTKGTHIVRDIDILKSLSEVANVYVSFTITTLESFHYRNIEPHAPHPYLRLQAMKMLSQVGIKVGVSIAPIMPGINDNVKTVRRIWTLAQRYGASFFFIDALKLDRSIKRQLFSIIKAYMPGMLKTYRELFKHDNKPLSLTIYTNHLRRSIENGKDSCTTGPRR